MTAYLVWLAGLTASLVVSGMESLRAVIDQVALESGFSGVVRVDHAGETMVCAAFGMADRAHSIANTLETQFGIASGTKGLTALTVMALVERGSFHLDTTARSLLGDRLPQIADDVTVEHLLAHRSGIGDYLDEEAIESISDYLMPVPVQDLATTDDYVRIYDAPTVFPAGERFAYNNAGYVVLAALAEAATGETFHDLVADLVCRPAGIRDTAFLRSDELPGRVAQGYLRSEGLWTNVLHLPVRGNGDGGLHTTVADLHALWEAIFAGRIVRPATLARMVSPHSDWPEESRRYGLGFHLHARTDEVFLEGYDAGVSFLSRYRPSEALTSTVIANWSEGAWPLSKAIREHLDG